MNIIEDLFCGAVGVKNATLEDIVVEIDELKEREIEDFEHTRGLYEFLSNLNDPTDQLR